MIDKACAIGNFVKFGGGGVVHHNNPITISSAALPFPKTNHDPPFKLVNVNFLLLF
jgi:hypothetical protein